MSMIDCILFTFNQYIPEHGYIKAASLSVLTRKMYCYREPAPIYGVSGWG